jgi:hypothetical protein
MSHTLLAILRLWVELQAKNQPTWLENSICFLIVFREEYYHAIFPISTCRDSSSQPSVLSLGGACLERLALLTVVHKLRRLCFCAKLGARTLTAVFGTAVHLLVPTRS